MSAPRAGFLVLLFLTAISGFSATNATLWGRVLDDDNAAVVGLAISLEPTYGGYGGGVVQTGPGSGSSVPPPPLPPLPGSDPRPTLYATTGRDGSFKFEGAPGPYYLTSEWGNYPRIYPARVSITLGEGETVTNFVFRVHRANVEVFGKVTGPAGEVFTNTVVYFRPPQSTKAPQMTGFTDENGIYRLRVFPGDWVGAVSSYVLNQLGYFVNGQTNLNFAAAGTNEVNFAVERLPYTLSGVVVDDRGEPIPNIRLTASRSNDASYNQFDKVSGPDGKFSFPVNSGTWTVGYGRWYGDPYLPYKWTYYNVEVAGNVTTNIVLPKFRSRIDGVVKTPEGEPIANISGQVVSGVGDANMYELFLTDTNGQFSVAVLNGDWRVIPNSYQFNQLGYLAPPGIGLSLVDSTNSVTFTASYPHSKLRGVVRDETGAAVTNLGFTVTAYEPTYATFPAVTDSQGRYVVGVPAGKWFYRVGGTNGTEHFHVGEIPPVEVGDGAEAVRDFTVVRAPHRIHVTLRDEYGAVFISTNTVMFGAYPMAEEQAPLFVSGWFYDGVADVFVAPGEWRITPWMQGTAYLPTPGAILTVTNDVSVTLTVRKRVFNSTLSGQVVDEQGVPVTNALVYVYAAAGSPQKAVDAQGRFSYEVSAGRLGVSVTADGYVTTSPTVDIAPGTNVFRLVRARKIAANLIVRIVAPQDLQIFGVYARARIGNDLFTRLAPSEDGVATLALFPGEWTISAYANSPNARQALRRPVVVTGGEQEITLDQFPQAPTAKIRGLVVDEHGNPVKVGSVLAETVDGVSRNGGVVDATFEVPVTAGRWWVTVQSGGSYSTYSATFNSGEIVDGQVADVGTIVMPKRDVAARTLLRTSAGTNPEFPAGINVVAKRTVNGVTYSVFGMRYNGDIPLTLTAGDWEFSFDNWEMPTLGFANIQPRILSIPQSGGTNTIVLDAVPATVTAPRFSIASEPGGKPRLRAHMDRTSATDIEYSTDLKTWRLRSDEYPSMGYVDIRPETATNRVQFFRAVTIE